jgi:dTMP kinase
MNGFFISFEGTEGSGKSTQISLLAEHLRAMGRSVRTIREPGGTPIGEEIRHTLKHSASNEAMTPETELLLMNASRAQLVREVIRPALQAGDVVLSDRFFDSTVAYQGYGRGLNLNLVNAIIDVAVGPTRPDLTMLLLVSRDISEDRLLARQATLPFMRDRIEEADRSFFERVAKGYHNIAASEPQRVRSIYASGTVEEIRQAIWKQVEPIFSRRRPVPVF